MSEELNQEQGTETKQEETKIDPFVEKAMELGWRPETEWEGNPEDFIDAKEFVRRKPLFDKIDHQSREIKEMRRAFDAFKEHHAKVKEAEYKRALAELKAEKRRALSDGETERALAIEDKIDDMNEQQQKFEQDTASTQPAQFNPEFVSWRGENSWYGQDRAMTAFADKIGVELAQRGYSPSEVLQEVSREVKKEFSHKFTNPRRTQASQVESGSRTSSKSEPEFQMTDDERRIMNRMVAAGAMTKDEYIKELKRVRG